MNALKIMLVLALLIGILATGNCYAGPQRGDGLHIPGNEAAISYARLDGLHIPEAATTYARLDGLHIPE